MSVPFVLTWFATLSFVGSFFTSKVPLWVPVGALVTLQLLQFYPLH